MARSARRAEAELSPTHCPCMDLGPKHDEGISMPNTHRQAAQALTMLVLLGLALGCSGKVQRHVERSSLEKVGDLAGQHHMLIQSWRFGFGVFAGQSNMLAQYLCLCSAPPPGSATC